MKIAFNTKLTTGLSLTPQMQQAIRLLQLSSVELEQEIQQKLDSNPLLERDDDDDLLQDNQEKNLEKLNHLDETFYTHSQTSEVDGFDDGQSFDDMDSVDRLESSELGDLSIDSEWHDVYFDESSSFQSDDDWQTNQMTTQANIQDHVRWQLNFKHLSDIETMIAEYLIDSMDEHGFIQLSTDELFQRLDMTLSFYQLSDVELEPADIEVVVKHIQSCEPLGVGARDLAECLLLQLQALPKDTPYLQQAKQLLKFQDYFVSNNITALLKATGLAVDDIQPCLALLRQLKPNPALDYQKNQTVYAYQPESYDIPDVLVSKQQNAWSVRLNPDILPKLRINQEYANLIRRDDQSEQGHYLKEQLQDARLFIRSIEERNQNLLKVASCIVKKQQDFLEQGVIAMQPLVLKDVADEVGLHESSVSRITTSKTMLTPKGLFSLKYFFSSQVASEDGGVSSTAICAKIKQMIDNENPKKPLSDSAIMETLQQQGIDIARRTVAKYRESMNIGSSTQRKQRY